MASHAFVDAVRGTIIPAVPVPFDHLGHINHGLQSQYVDWMSGHAIGGVAVWAHTGRGLHLSQEERMGVLTAWKSGCPDLPIVCAVGVPADTPLPDDPAHCLKTVIEATMSMAHDAKTGGAEALLVYPPKWLAGLPQAGDCILEYHEAITEVGLPVLAFYLYEAAGGVSYTPDLVDAIVELPGVVGIKVATLDSIMTFQDLALQLKARNTMLVTGEDRFLGYTFTQGAETALIGMATAVTDLCVSLLDSYRNNDFNQFIEQNRAMDSFAMSTFRAPMEGYVQRMLWAAEADGAFDGAAFDRHAPSLPSDERERVRAALDEIRKR